MKIEIDVPDYSTEQKFLFEWEPGFIINAINNPKGEAVIIQANRAGLISLAKHLLELSNEQIYEGYDFHLDEYNSLEKGSYGLAFQRIGK